jgi:hypothetical protein
MVVVVMMMVVVVVCVCACVCVCVCVCMCVCGGGWGEQVQHALKQAGVETIMSGKWHLNTEERDAAWDYAERWPRQG